MKKSTLRTCLIILAVCLGISLASVLLNRSTSRDATAEEITASRNYVTDWTAVPGWEAGMTEKEFILNLCSAAEEQTIGDVVQTTYRSDVLGNYLYRCHELTEILLRQDYLYLSYLAEDKDMVILAYTDAGIYEICIYDAQEDTMYHEIDGSIMVWNKFRSGFQWGK